MAKILGGRKDGIALGGSVKVGMPKGFRTTHDYVVSSLTQEWQEPEEKVTITTHDEAAYLGGLVQEYEEPVKEESKKPNTHEIQVAHCQVEWKPLPGEVDPRVERAKVLEAAKRAEERKIAQALLDQRIAAVEAELRASQEKAALREADSFKNIEF